MRAQLMRTIAPRPSDVMHRSLGRLLLAILILGMLITLHACGALQRDQSAEEESTASKEVVTGTGVLVAYTRPDISAIEAEELQGQMERQDLIACVTKLSPEEGLNKFRELFSGELKGIGRLRPHDLPWVYEIYVLSSGAAAGDDEFVPAMREIAQLDGIEEVRESRLPQAQRDDALLGPCDG